MPQKPRILFVDDEPNVLHSLRRELRSRSAAWDMAFFSSPIEALDEHRRNPFDVAITDLKMPTMNGFDAIHRIRRISPETVVIMLTGVADLSVTVKAINENIVFRFYPKPCAMTELTKGIEAALHHKETSALHSRKFAEKIKKASKGSPAVADSDHAEASLLDHLRIGAIIVDEQARIVYTNQTGADLIAKNDGLLISGTGLCRATKTEDSEKLQELIRRTVDGTGNENRATELTLPLPRKHSARPLAVMAHRRTLANSDKPSAVLLIHDPDLRQGPSEGDIADILGITFSEARLAKQLANGKPLEAASRMLGLTNETGRTYLKRIFQKTGARRQADLVRMVLTSTLAG